MNTKAVLHGCKHEADAIKAYKEETKNSHADFKLSRCGLVSGFFAGFNPF